MSEIDSPSITNYEHCGCFSLLHHLLPFFCCVRSLSVFTELRDKTAAADQRERLLLAITCEQKGKSLLPQFCAVVKLIIVNK